MDNDRLKDFIEKNRDQFDQIETPNFDHIWNDVNPKKKSNADQQTKQSRWIALILVLVLLTAGLWYNTYQTNQKLNQLEQFVMSSPMYKMEHEKLVQLVADKEQLIKESDIQETEYEELFQELNELENNKELFEKDFELYGDSRELMRTLFKNYERKAKILELLLFENEKKSHDENNNRHEM